MPRFVVIETQGYPLAHAGPQIRGSSCSVYDSAYDYVIATYRSEDERPGVWQGRIAVVQKKAAAHAARLEAEHGG